MAILRSEKAYLKKFKAQIGEAKAQSVVETTDSSIEMGHYSAMDVGKERGCPDKLFHSSAILTENQNIGQNQPTRRNPSMQEMTGRYKKVDRPFHDDATSRPNTTTEALQARRFSPASLTLLQKILVANVIIITAGAIIGSYLTAQLAEAGQFNPVTFGIIIGSAILLSGSTSFLLLKIAFRPFEELQRVITKIHTGNPRARAALDGITDPDIRHFTGAVNQMLTRLEENARIIQEDQRQLQLMTARVINAQEMERKRIARELHDEASQVLTAMIMGLDSVQQDIPASNRILQAKLDGLKHLANFTLEELRKLALDLRPTMLDDLGLLPAVRWLSRTAAERSSLEVKVRVDGFEESERLAPELETCLFRITQESLTNITRHAAARQVEIKLERLSSFETSLGDGWGAVRLTVADDGKGFRPAEAKIASYQGGHLGLFDIEERAALLGGKVEIESYCAGDSTGPSGTKIIVTVPLSGSPVESPHDINTHAAPYIQPQPQ